MYLTGTALPVHEHVYYPYVLWYLIIQFGRACRLSCVHVPCVRVVTRYQVCFFCFELKQK